MLFMSSAVCAPSAHLSRWVLKLSRSRYAFCRIWKGGRRCFTSSKIRGKSEIQENCISPEMEKFQRLSRCVRLGERVCLLKQSPQKTIIGAHNMRNIFRKAVGPPQSYRQVPGDWFVNNSCVFHADSTRVSQLMPASNNPMQQWTSV